MLRICLSFFRSPCFAQGRLHTAHLPNAAAWVRLCQPFLVSCSGLLVPVGSGRRRRLGCLAILDNVLGCTWDARMHWQMSYVFSSLGFFLRENGLLQGPRRISRFPSPLDVRPLCPNPPCSTCRPITSADDPLKLLGCITRLPVPPIVGDNLGSKRHGEPTLSRGDWSNSPLLGCTSYL
ncbi:hypothetical protein DFH11DRAFT_106329 [Phellopilus nigrolimitatus]|nr:hypothetical protein DFH11DRAFT_106329 [Phellopilus nigrolimitatus]